MRDEIALDDAMRRKLQSHPLGRAIAELAGRQHGVVARWQLCQLGLSPRAIDRRIAAGLLHVVHRGVYAVGHKRLTQCGRWMAAVLAGGPGASLSHRSAAALHRIRRLRGGEKIEITVVRTPPRIPSLVARRSPLPPDEVTDIDGIPVTTVSRTLLDLAAVTTADDVERAIREADYLRLADATGIETLLDRYPRRRGSVAMRAALERMLQSAGRTKEELEARFKSLLFAADLPPPEFNATVELDGTTFELDVLWRDQRLAIELDGWQAHGTRHAFESDRERDRKLAIAGFRVIRVTWHQLDAALIADLRRLLAHKAPALASRT